MSASGHPRAAVYPNDRRAPGQTPARYPEPDLAPRLPSSPGRQLRLQLLAALSLVGMLVALFLSLPSRAGFVFYLSGEGGASLAAAVNAAAGHISAGYPYGPLSLALERFSLLPLGPRPLGAIWLGALAAVLFAGVLGAAVQRLRLGRVPAGLLAVAAVYMTLVIPWVPAYELEPVALVLAVICWSAEGLEWALFWCVVGALIQPRMALVLGAWFSAGIIWLVVHRARSGRRFPTGLVLRRLRVPVVAAAGVLIALGVWCGPRTLLALVSPRAASGQPAAALFLFFTRAGNPFLLAGAHSLRYWLGTPLALWGLGTLLLAVALIGYGRAPAVGSPNWMRWFAAWGCLAATVAFVLFFYRWQFAYVEYLFLPLVGLAVLRPRPRRIPDFRIALLLLAVLGAWTVVRADLHAWRSERSRTTTAGLWATAADAAAWQGFVAANPPASHPLFLLEPGSPAALFPAYAEPGDAYAVAGEAAPAELSALARRLDAAGCVAYRPGGPALTAAQVAAIRARQPQAQVGDLFQSFGCAPAGR